MKNFVKDVGTSLNRAAQKADEALFAGEKTEYDSHFQQLMQQCDVTQKWTEKIISNTEAMLEPNIALRVEKSVDKIVDKFQGKQRGQMSNNIEDVGNVMSEAGPEIGSSSSYGSSLMKAGQAFLRVGQGRDEYKNKVQNAFIQPLKHFLEFDIKNIAAERRKLENYRLDLDSAKTKLKKAKSDTSKKSLDDEVGRSQSTFDKQLEVTKLLLEDIPAAHNRHLSALNEMVEAEAHYYAQSHQLMQDLQRQIARG